MGMMIRGSLLTLEQLNSVYSCEVCVGWKWFTLPMLHNNVALICITFCDI